MFLQDVPGLKVRVRSMVRFEIVMKTLIVGWDKRDLFTGHEKHFTIISWKGNIHGASMDRTVTLQYKYLILKCLSNVFVNM